jgi:hypothetical protein
MIKLTIHSIDWYLKLLLSLNIFLILILSYLSSFILSSACVREGSSGEGSGGGQNSAEKEGNGD